MNLHSGKYKEVIMLILSATALILAQGPLRAHAEDAVAHYRIIQDPSYAGFSLIAANADEVLAGKGESQAQKRIQHACKLFGHKNGVGGKSRWQYGAVDLIDVLAQNPDGTYSAIHFEPKQSCNWEPSPFPPIGPADACNSVTYAIGAVFTQLTCID